MKAERQSLCIQYPVTLSYLQAPVKSQGFQEQQLQGPHDISNCGNVWILLVAKDVTKQFVIAEKVPMVFSKSLEFLSSDFQV